MLSLYGCFVATLTLSLGACSPDPGSTPTSVPTVYQCTPEVGGAPYACTEAQHQEMLAKDALYAEAERIYRDYYGETQLTFEGGGPPSARLLSHVTGDAVAIVRKAHAEGIRAVHGAPTLHWVKRSVGASMEGSTIALASCSDTTAVTFEVEGEPSWSGIVSQETIYLSQTPDGLKISYLEYREVVSCG